jgi:hypothetical protein
LPLKRGSRLVVDASLRVVRSGLTDPKVLLQLKRKGVEIYSREGLHAKVFVFSRCAFVGSTNLSHRSAGSLIEALVEVSDGALVSQLRRFVDGLRLVEMSEDWLKELVREYRPPKVPPGDDRSARKARKPTRPPRIVPALKILQLGYVDEGPEQTAERRKGTRDAKGSPMHRRGYRIGGFNLVGRDKQAKRGDWFLQVTKEPNGAFLVSPPARVVHRRRIPNSRALEYAYYLDEVPGSRRRALHTLAARFGRGGSKLLLSNARVRDPEQLEQIFALFRRSLPSSMKRRLSSRQ